MFRTTKIQKHLAILLLTSLLIFSASHGYGQTVGGMISGIVTDTSGATIPNAKIVIKNTATGQERTIETNTAGLYSAPNLLAGNYAVTVSAAGFSTEMRTGVALNVGAQLVLNVAMKVGLVSSAVEVQVDVPVVQLSSSDISGVVDRGTIVELPLNGRDWTQLATLQPGVDSAKSIQPDTSTKNRARQGYGVQLDISGSLPTQNNYRIDGISANDYANSSPGSVEGSSLGVDAIQEFSVLTSNYSAEYGRTAGGIINAITRSGTNLIHGSAFEFARNSALDARNYFDPATIPDFHRNDFGGSLGGPIRKDRTFFFANYEGLRETRGVSTQINVLSPAARSGLLCSTPPPTDPNPCSPQQIQVDPTVAPFLGLWAPPNNGLVGNGDTGIYLFNQNRVISENFESGKIDHRLSDKDTIFGTYQHDSATGTQPDSANEVLVGNATSRTLIAVEETHIFSSQLLNTVRFGFNRTLHKTEGKHAINPLSASTALGEYAGANNPIIDVPGLAQVQPGLNQIERINVYGNSFQVYDDAFLVKGIHDLKFGFSAERIQLNPYNPAPAGEFPFGSLQNFLENRPDVLFGPVPSAPFVHFGFRSSVFGAYLQDDIRLRPNFTINLGVRYDMSTVPAERQGRFSTLRSPTDTTPHIGKTAFNNPTTLNFEPRIGFAWDPFGNGKSSVRGGFGIFDVLPLPYLFGTISTNAAPFVESGSASNLQQGDFPTIAFTKLANSANNGQGLRYPYVQPNPERNYVMQWNLNLQQELAPNLMAMIAYVGSRGVHQVFRADTLNAVPPKTTSAPILWPIPGTGNLPNPTVGQLDALTWDNHSSFDALEAQLTKKMSHGLEGQLSYTWSKAIDMGDSSIASDTFANSISSLFYLLPKYRRAVADFNVPHNITASFTWELPIGKSLTGPAAWAVSGWQVGGILVARSGLPFTPLIGGDPLGLMSTNPFAYPDVLRGSGCGSLTNPGNVTNYLKLNCFALPMQTPAIASLCQPFGFAANPPSPIPGTCANLLGNGGRNEVYGPGMLNFDFSLFKNNKISENVNLQFRAEFFNVINHSNFNSPIANSTLFDQNGIPVGNAGALDSTSTTNREIQFGVKLAF
jgi:hypothetical protein